jgi:hypothetical protein
LLPKESRAVDYVSETSRKGKLSAKPLSMLQASSLFVSGEGGLRLHEQRTEEPICLNTSRAATIAIKKLDTQKLLMDTPKMRRP